jgi:hypothetical protein
MTGFDSIQVRFKNTPHIPSPLANTRVVPFVVSYFEILKAVVNDVKTEYFWFFSNFVKLDDIDLDYIPEQHEHDQIHVWYTTHPKGGLNKEGNVMLIPTKKFKEQMQNLKFLRDYRDINYHPHGTLFQRPITKNYFKLSDPYEAYNSNNIFYQWMVNKDLKDIELPDYYPSFWEDEKLYTWGETKDIILAPYRDGLKQFHDIDRCVHFDFDYSLRPMDIIFISYDEPGAEERFASLKLKFPRAQWCKGVKGQTLAYITAANMSKTDYFYAVFPKIDVVDDFKFDFQPDRLKHPCHYIFDCYNEVIDCTYGHDGVILYNKKLVLKTTSPGLDFTLSQPVQGVPILSAVNRLDETPLLAWRTAFREVIKLKLQKSTVENSYRLKKWLTPGKGDNAGWVNKGALDAVDFLDKGNDPYNSYDFDWIKKYFEERHG